MEIREIIFLLVDVVHATYQECFRFITRIVNGYTIQKSLEDLLQKKQEKEHLSIELTHRLFLQRYKQYASLNIEFVTIMDEHYPECLHNMIYPPIILFYKGDWSILTSKKRLGITGNEQLSYYAQHLVEYVVRELPLEYAISGSILSNVSTLAYEKATLCNVDSVVVLGKGFHDYYPFKNMFLRRKIEKNGLVVSEYPLDYKGKIDTKRHDELVVGLSSVLCVVEEMKNGYSLKKAYEALEQSKDVLVPPANLFSSFSEGSNYLLQQGAHVLLTKQDVIDALSNARV